MDDAEMFSLLRQTNTTQVGHKTLEPALTPLVPQPYTLAEQARRALAQARAAKQAAYALQMVLAREVF